MKKLLAFAAVGLMLAFQLKAFAAPGQPTFTIEAGIEAKAGEEITVPITVSNNPGFTSVGFVVNYNSNALEIIGVTSAASMMPLNSQFLLTDSPGTQWIHLINTNLVDWSGSGTVVNIRFIVKSNAPTGLSPVYLSFTGSPDGTPANSYGDVLWDARVISGSVDISDTGGTGTKYPVTYGLNGGSGAILIESDKEAGQRFTAFSGVGIVPPAGKQFKLWNTSPNGTGASYYPGEPITMPAAPLTLYAIWEDETAVIEREEPNNITPPPTDNTGSDSGLNVTDLSTGSGSNPNWLPQAGSVFLPIPILAIFGALMLIPCVVLLSKKK